MVGDFLSYNPVQHWILLSGEICNATLCSRFDSFHYYFYFIIKLISLRFIHIIKFLIGIYTY